MAHILILEDNHDMMLALSEILDMQGHTVSHGYSGRDGLNHLKSTNRLPDLILSDVTMPEMGGFEFLQNVQDHPIWSRIPTAIMSGRRTDDKMALELGAAAFIVKPFKFEELLHILQIMLASA